MITLEEFDFPRQPELPAAQIRGLASIFHNGCTVIFVGL